ncbi:MAG: DNA polymerase III subunit beta [Fimbriimonas sp.]
MKFDCPRKEFSDAVSAAANGAAVRSSQVILQSLKVEATDSGIRILGCDGEMWVERTVACLVTEPGAVCVQAKTLNELASSLTTGDVHFQTLDGSGALLSQGASEYRLQTLDADDFPEPPSFGGDGQLSLKAGVFRRAVDSVGYAVSSDEHRQVLRGILMQYNGSTLTLVATDTHRLAVRRMPLEGAGEATSVVIPDKALKAIKSLPIDDDKDLTLVLGNQRVGVEAAGAKVVSQLLVGAYPNWERVVPSETTRTWSMAADQLKEKVKRTLIIARDNAGRVKFSAKGDEVELSAHSDEKGDARERVDIISNNGEVEIAFNGKYVLDTVEAIEGEGVRVEMTESSRPAIFRPTETDEYFCVIMPMHLA